MNLRFRLLGKNVLIAAILFAATLLIFGAGAPHAARASALDFPTPTSQPGLVDMLTSDNEQGLIGVNNLELFGPETCTGFGDPFSTLVRPGGAPNPWYSQLNGVYTYRIGIPSGYQFNYDKVRVELLDPVTGNTATVPSTIYRMDGSAVTGITCNSPQDPCVWSTGDPANPYWYIRMDENRYNCATPPGGYGSGDQYNTRTLFRLYYFNDAMEPVDLAYYVGKKDDASGQTGTGHFSIGAWTAAQTDAQAQAEAVSTMLRWVSPGAPADERMPAFNVGSGLNSTVNGLATVVASAPEPATVTEDCDSVRQNLSITNSFLTNFPVSTASQCSGNGDFIVDLTSEAPGIYEDPGSLVRYLYLDVRSLTGGSENNWHVWAGPALSGAPESDESFIAPSDVNARQVYLLRHKNRIPIPTIMHPARGPVVFGVGDLPLNHLRSNRVRFPIAYLGAEYAGLHLAVQIFDADGGALEPVIFYMDSMSQNNWEACFVSAANASRCVTDQGGSAAFRVGDAPNLNVPDAWGDYLFTLPGATGPTPFIAGRLTAYFLSGQMDTFNMTITALPPDAPVLVAPDDGASVQGTPPYSWLASSTATAYQFEYDDTPNFDNPIYTSGEITGLSFTPPDQAVGTYYWHVRAQNLPGNWGAWSGWRMVTILPPTAPSVLTATAISPTQIDLAWTDNSSIEDGFRIERAPAGSGSWAVVDTTAADVTTYSDTTVSCGTGYDYRVTATDAGGDSDPSNTASATTFTCIGLSDASLDFDGVVVGQTSSPLSVTLTNTGENPLTLGSLGITGDFALTPADDSCSGQTLAPGGTCSFSVTFSPTQPGSRTGEVSILSDTAIILDTVSLSGTGIGIADLAVTKTVSNATPAEGAAVQYTVTVENLGPDDASGVVVNDLAPAGLTYLSSTASPGTVYTSTTGVWAIGPLDAGQTATLTLDVSANAGTTGQTITNTASATLDTSVAVDLAADNNTDSASLVVTQPAVELSETSLDFGNLPVGTPSAPLSVTLTNPGNALLTVGSLGVTGDFALPPAADGCSGQTIDPEGTCSFSVTFTPALAGLRTGEVTIPSNASSSPDSVSLSGGGQPLPPALTSPKNGAAVYTRKPKLTWKAMTGASLYHVQIDDNDDFSSPVPDSDADAPNPTFTPPSALPFGTYYWHVQARVNGVWSEYSMPYTFDVTLHRLPRKNAAIYPRRPEFTWLKVKNASLPYQLHVWDNADCSSDPLLEKTSRKPTYTLARGDALDLGTYSWRVSADSGQSWTPCWRFDVTNLKTPKSWGAVYTTKPKFTWAANAAATGGYELTVSLHPDDGSPDVVKIDGHPTKKLGYTATAADGLDFGRYLWLVEECAPLCDGDTSGIPARGLYITNMVAPRNDLFTLKGKITFTWKQVTGASTYQLVVSEDPDDLDPAVFNPPATSALKRVSPTLPRGTYYWHIVTSNGKTMPTWTFTVGP